MGKTFLSMVLFCSLLFFGAACTSMPEGNPADGERWFRMHRCNGCHGERGAGGRGPVIAGLKLGYSRFRGKLRAPRSQVMPAFEENVLPDRDAADIYLWLRAQAGTTQKGE